MLHAGDHAPPEVTPGAVFLAFPQEGGTNALPVVSEGDEETADSGDFDSGSQPQESFIKRHWQATLKWARTTLERHQSISRLLGAIRSGDTLEVLEALTENAGVLADFRSTYDGNTVWHLLAEYGDASQLQALINFIKIHAHTEEMQRIGARLARRPLHSDELISALIGTGNHLHQTPLMFAAYHGREESVKLLLQQGADAWAQDRCGHRTAMHYACRKAHVPCVRALLDQLTPAQQVNAMGLRYVDVRTASGYTPLHFAVATNSVQCVRVLLAYGANMGYFNFYNSDDFWVSCPPSSTPLHLAAMLGYHNVAMALLRTWWDTRQERGEEAAGPDPRRFMDKKRHTPFQCALKAGHEELAEKLHPLADIDSMWTPGDLAKFAGTGSVPSLQVIVASVLEARLMASIQDSVDCMKLLGTYQQTGRVFGRQGAYSPDSGMADDPLVKSMGQQQPELNYDMPAQQLYGGVPGHMQPAAMRTPMPTESGAGSRHKTVPSTSPGQIGPGSNKQTTTNVTARVANGHDLSVSPPASAGNVTGGSPPNSSLLACVPPSPQIHKVSSSANVTSSNHSQVLLPPGPLAALSTASAQPFARPSFKGAKYSLGLDELPRGSSGSILADGTGGMSSGSLALHDQSPSSPGGPTTIMTQLSSLNGQQQPSMGPHLRPSDVSTASSGAFMQRFSTGMALNASRASIRSTGNNGEYALRFVGVGEHALAIKVYPLHIENEQVVCYGVSLMSVPGAIAAEEEAEQERKQQLLLQQQQQANMTRASSALDVSQSISSQTGAGVEKLSSGQLRHVGSALQLYGGAHAPRLSTLGRSSTQPNSGQNCLVTNSVHEHRSSGGVAGLSSQCYSPAGYSPGHHPSSKNSRNRPTGSRTSVAPITNGKLETLKAWIGYDRMYDVQRGAKLGEHGQEASSLRQYETGLERKRKAREAAARPRAYLCGVLPLPHCFFDEGQAGDSEHVLRPGVDVCGMCMDNKPLLEMRNCRHRICIMCAKARCHLLELRQLVTCPYCTTIVVDFTLA